MAGATYPGVAKSGCRRALEEPDKKSQPAMTLIKNFKLPRGILARSNSRLSSRGESGWVDGCDAQQPTQAKMKRIKKFISTFIVTLVERDLPRS